MTKRVTERRAPGPKATMDYEQVWRMVHVDKRTAADVAATFGVTRQAVHYALKRHAALQGVARDAVQRPLRYDRAQVLRLYYDEHMRIDDLVAKMGIGEAAIRAIVASHREGLRENGEQVPRRVPLNEWWDARRKYDHKDALARVQAGESPAHVARDLGVTPAAVYKLIRKAKANTAGGPLAA